jgi:release factor glutamine methyltransferase
VTTIGSILVQRNHARREIEMILEHVTGRSRASVIAHPEHTLSDDETHKTQQLIARRVAGEPMAYILGTREFFGLNFRVTPDVLIPRPETEVLVEQALARLSKANASRCLRILDLGTGSGAIAVSLAMSLTTNAPGTEITATDISTAALAIATENARLNGVQIRFVVSDWFAALANEKFDLIVSNPPYVAHGDPHLTSGDLRFEPIGALTDGAPNERGLACIKRIIADAPQHLNDGGWLLFEHGYDQANDCAALLAAHGFNELLNVPDLAGIPRVSGGKYVHQS